MPFAPGHEGWIQLNPGPAGTTERVRAVQQRGDSCHRESEFSALLLELPDDYAAVLVTGSGTAAMELAVISACRSCTA